MGLPKPEACGVPVGSVVVEPPSRVPTDSEMTWLSSCATEKRFATVSDSHDGPHPRCSTDVLHRKSPPSSRRSISRSTSESKSCRYWWCDQTAEASLLGFTPHKKAESRTPQVSLLAEDKKDCNAKQCVFK